MIIRLHGITVNHDAVASFIGNDCTAKAVMHRLTKLEVLGNQYDAELTAIKEIVANRARAAGTPRCFAAAAPKSKATKTTTASAAAKEETGGAVKGRVGGVKRASAVEGEKGTPIKRARFHDAALKKTHIEMNDEDEEMMESDDAEDEERGSE